MHQESKHKPLVGVKPATTTSSKQANLKVGKQSNLPLRVTPDWHVLVWALPVTLAFSLAGLFGFALKNTLSLREEEDGNGLNTMDQLSAWWSVTAYNYPTVEIL